jgi:hypothetical protein
MSLHDCAKNPPVLRAFPVGKDQVRVWCPYCAVWHVHGAANLGHRTAHCYTEDSPFKQTGYIVQLAPKGLK